MTERWPASVRSSLPVSRSHTFSVLSPGRGHRPPPVRRHRHAIDPIRVAGERAEFAARVSRSHTFSVLSSEADTARLPSAVTATPLTPAVWPASVRSSLPVSRSHTFSVLSSDADTARLPSAVTATPLTPAVWPASVRSSLPVSRSHTFSVLSSGRGHRPPPVRRHRHATDLSRVAGERAEFAPRLQIPHLQRLVIGRGHRPPPVRRHRHATDHIRVAGERAEFAARSPDPTPSASDPRTRTPPASRPPSPPRH